MKRALAERAKQSGLPNGLAASPQTDLSSRRNATTSRSTMTTASSSTTSSRGPLSKVPRLETSVREPMSSASSVSSGKDGGTGTRPPRGSKKRQRDATDASSSNAAATGSAAPVRRSASSDDEEEDDANFSAFYLRHQNRALASEMKNLKYQLAQLERERDYRRTQCGKACQSLNSLQATWTQMETALQLGQQPSTSGNSSAYQDGDDSNNRTNSNTMGPPMSTGSGKSVELIGSLLDSLAALGNKPPREPRKSKKKKKRRKRRRRIRSSDDEDDSDGDDDGDNPNLNDSDNDSVASSASSVSSASSSSSNLRTTGNTLMEGAERQQLDDLLRITDNVSQRANTLQEWIWSLLKQLENQQTSKVSRKSFHQTDIHNHSEKLSRQLAQQKAKNRKIRAQLKEVARTRDEMQASDRRVRRGLYRLAAGRVQLKEVLKAIKRSDEDKEAAAAWMEVATPTVANVPSSTGALSSSAGVSGATPLLVSSSSSNAPATKEAVAERIESQDPNSKQNSQLVDSAQVQKLQKQVKDLEQVASSRQEQISKFLVEQEVSIKRINSLVFSKDENKSTTNSTTATRSDYVASDQEVQRSDLYAELSAKLATSTRTVEELRENLKIVKEEWAKALGDAELAKKTMQELQQKHSKKWAELAHAGNSGGADGEDNGPDDKRNLAVKQEDSSGNVNRSQNSMNVEAETTSSSIVSAKGQAELIVTLQHKLTQALENVRQAETTRQTLSEAVTMNESLQAKLDEVKTKYSALQAGRSSGSSSNSNHVSSSSSSAGTSSSGVTTPKQKSSSSTGNTGAEKTEKAERHRDRDREHRKMRKEISALTASKEAAKAKLERTEKERDSLIQTNGRLLKQAAEKDEMNAKSLSSILHLKQVTEQIEKERKSLEQQAKSAHQLALAARLATNARERLAEEYQKERKSFEQKLADLQQKCASIAEGKDTVDGKLGQQKAKMSTLLKDVTKAKERCDEMASESTKLKEEKQTLAESLAIAQREASEAIKQAKSAAGNRTSGSSHSEFTVDQLSTQVSVLKGRLACPVCNHRDKKCILLRCRHMFCRPCVDENIKNRSRKCPACGGRFDMKDVADVWL